VAAALILPLILIPEMPNYVRLLLGGIIYLAVYMTILPIIRGLEKVDIEVLGKFFRNYEGLRPVIDLISAPFSMPNVVMLSLLKNLIVSK